MGRFGAVSQKRYGLIDSFRGFTLLSMLIYHLAYDIICIFGGNFDWFTQPWVMAWERSISFSFVVDLSSLISSYLTVFFIIYFLF